VISAAENSNKFQKTRFWKEKSVEDMVTLGPTALATLGLINEASVLESLLLDFQHGRQVFFIILGNFRK